ncbi:PH domain-containing protein [Streptomyces justiciae]|uniref:PH domain-containing protein n=1 Tax=Streptomyces justiciae TaxID=2780140 RepID=A0ABU3M384_9ACTN|nr:PH domain-containing protein [Streptomyces justiciae]MDT7845971.1 PH domain-containing protein [Streptomyces justiciae]
MDVTVRVYRADRRSRLKVLGLIAVMLACGVLEVVINDVPGWLAAILITVLAIVDGVWALSLWRTRTVVRADGLAVVGVARTRTWAWHDIRDLVVETQSSPPRRLIRLHDVRGRKTTLPYVTEAHLPDLHALRPH